MRFGQSIPQKLQIPALFLLLIVVIFLGTFLLPETPNSTYTNRGISIGGLFVFYGVLYITSASRTMIPWRTVLIGLLAQYLISLFVLRTQVGYSIFSFVSSLARCALLAEFKLTREESYWDLQILGQLF